MIPDFNGSGILILETGKQLKGKFRASHSLDRVDGLLIEFSVDDADTNAYPLSKDFIQALRFEGTTIDGREIIADGILCLSTSVTRTDNLTIQLELLPIKALEIGLKKSGKSVRFLIPNLRFTGLEISEYQTREGIDSRMDRLEFEVPFEGKQLKLTLKQLPNYKEAEEKLRKGTVSQWTCTCTIRETHGNLIDIDLAIKCANLFLLLTSLAMGKHVSWVSAELLDKEDSVVYQYIKRGTVSNKRGLPSSLIGNGQLLSINNRVESPYQNFINVAFHSFQSFEEKQQKALRDAIDSYCEAVEIRIHPTPLKLTARSFETLIRVFLDDRDRIYSVPGLDLIAKLYDLLQQFVDLLKQYDPDMSNEFKTRLSGKIEGLLRRPFKVTLTKILDKYLTQTNNPYDPSWVRKFVDARNDATHGREMTLEHYEAWLKGNNLLEKLLMKILKYQGPYVERVGFYFDWKILN